MNPINRTLSYLLGGIDIFMQSACTQTVGHFSPTVASNPSNTVFYLYRPTADSPGVMKPLEYNYPDVLIDGKSIGVLMYDEFLVTELTPGAHNITITGLTTVSNGWADRDTNQVIPTSQNKQVFMKLQVEDDVDEMNLGQLGAKYTIQLMPVDAENS